ncbi:hypothetical protein [Salmonella phage SSBI34]|nr:hypothetical protein [Salmonella phage SSBI34]
MLQYSHKLDVGKIGTCLSVYALTEEGNIHMTYSVTLNGKGFKIDRWYEDDPSQITEVCDFDSFLYPDRIEDGEVDMVIMLMGSNIKTDRLIIDMCSMLCAQYAAGHSEEALFKTVNDSIKYWSESGD